MTGGVSVGTTWNRWQPSNPTKLHPTHGELSPTHSALPPNERKLSSLPGKPLQVVIKARGYDISVPLAGIDRRLFAPSQLMSLPLHALCDRMGAGESVHRSSAL